MLTLNKHSLMSQRVAGLFYSLSSAHLMPLQKAVFPNPNRTNKTPLCGSISQQVCPATASAGGAGILGNTISSPTDPYIQAGLQRELMPKHVAAILDGNRRWAKAHDKELDYTAFCQGYMALADLCIRWGVGTLSCFIFSTDNWKRTKEANDLLFRQFKRTLEESLESCMRKGIRVMIIGEKTKLPKCLQEVIKEVEEATKNNSLLELLFAVNYGGKWDITQAIQSTSKMVEAGVIEPEDVDEALLEQQLTTQMSRYPDPDLLIRTGGDHRVSNFLMWQMYHTEFYFTDIYGPDFGESEFINALRLFQQCDRLFGL